MDYHDRRSQEVNREENATDNCTIPALALGSRSHNILSPEISAFATILSVYRDAQTLN